MCGISVECGRWLPAWHCNPVLYTWPGGMVCHTYTGLCMYCIQYTIQNNVHMYTMRDCTCTQGCRSGAMALHLAPMELPVIAAPGVGLILRIIYILIYIYIFTYLTQYCDTCPHPWFMRCAAALWDTADHIHLACIMNSSRSTTESNYRWRGTAM